MERTSDVRALFYSNRSDEEVDEEGSTQGFTLKRDKKRPTVIEMSDWFSYSIAQTGIEMAIHLALFTSRFDIRKLLAADKPQNEDDDPFFHDHSKDDDDDCNKDNFVFDFQADCGDGFHSSYAIAYLLAQPTIDILTNDVVKQNLLRMKQFGRKGELISRKGKKVKLRVREYVEDDDVLEFRSKNVSVCARCQGCEQDRSKIMRGDIVMTNSKQDKFIVTWVSKDSKRLHVRRYHDAQYKTVETQISKVKSTGLIRLRRGRILIIGGDLAYPTPSIENYTKRFVHVFEQALTPPVGRSMFSVDKTKFDTKKHKGPIAYLVPGNHDYFDGLHCFSKFVIQSDWLGGWLMPQRKSYFALKLPMDWYVNKLGERSYWEVEIWSLSLSLMTFMLNQSTNQSLSFTQPQVRVWF